MHRVFKVEASRKYPERYFIEKLEGDTWYMALDVSHRPLWYTNRRHAELMANALDGGVFPARPADFIKEEN